MKKYLYLLKIQLGLVTTYRFELVWTLAARILVTSVYIFLWKLTTRTNEDFYKILQYFLLYYMIIEPASTSRAAKRINDYIHSGEISSFLVKPINFPLSQIIAATTVVGTRVFLPMIIMIPLIIFFPTVFAPLTLLNLILFYVYFFLALVLWNSFVINIGVIAFWGTETGHTLSVTDLFIRIFKGGIVPAYLFPEHFNKILSFTPFPYMGSFVIAIYQEDLDLQNIIKSTLIMLFWIVLFTSLFAFNYKRGLARYEAAG